MAKRLKKKLHFNLKKHTAIIFLNKSYTNIFITLLILNVKLLFVNHRVHRV